MGAWTWSERALRRLDLLEVRDAGGPGVGPEVVALGAAAARLGPADVQPEPSAVWVAIAAGLAVTNPLVVFAGDDVAHAVAVPEERGVRARHVLAGGGRQCGPG